MRHLSVPRQETQQILSQLKAEFALPQGARVQPDPSDSKRTLIPVKEGTESELLSRYPVVHAEPLPCSNGGALTDVIPDSRYCQHEHPVITQLLPS